MLAFTILRIKRSEVLIMCNKSCFYVLHYKVFDLTNVHMNIRVQTTARDVNNELPDQGFKGRRANQKNDI